MRHFLLFVLLFTAGYTTAQTMCLDSEEPYIIEVHSDEWPYEIGWYLTNADGDTVASAPIGSYVGNIQVSVFDTVCVPAGTFCYTLQMVDSYGDGIVQGGYAALHHGGSMLYQTGAYTFSTSYLANCPFDYNCDANMVPIVVEVRTDDWAEETHWTISASNGFTYSVSPGYYTQDYTVYSDTICVPQDACITFSILDTYGDGINDGTQSGYVHLWKDNNIIFNPAPNFGSGTAYQFNCPVGFQCETAIEVATGTHTAPGSDYWYSFTAAESGGYTISTCGEDCDTKIWVYSECNLASIGEDVAGTLSYNDNNPDCGEQAQLTMNMQAGTTYLIRIGDAGTACGLSEIAWSLVYNGPSIGCTDPTACNYDPLATVDDGSCIPQDDPECPDGPDLLMVQEALINSIAAGTEDSQDGCLVSEGCLTGFGIRDVIRFDTHIKNIGEYDYIIGSPNPNSGQFTFDNCHNHYHYEGYAQYLLYDAAGNQIPIGFKNGFCVLDLECSDGGTAQYSCGYMGISTGCGDIYGSYLDCQWVDVTDIPDGSYVLVTRVNWDNSPDMLGHIESNMLNNWAQVCLTIDRSNGPMEVVINPDCQPYTDCNGTLYGNAVVDCNGICGGTAVRGDLNTNNSQDMTDSEMYVTHVLADDLAATPCNDLNADGDITVFDAAMLASCINQGSAHPHPGSGIHDHCNFPSDIYNPSDSTWVSIAAHNADESYIDVAIRNPYRGVNAYQFEVSGIVMQSVTSLTDVVDYPQTVQGNFGGTVVGISYQDSSLNKSVVAQPLVRIHYSAITATEICISNVVDIVSEDGHRVWDGIENACVVVSGTENTGNAYAALVQPNPFSRSTTLLYSNPGNEALTLSISDATGRIVRVYRDLRGEALQIDADGLPAGVYMYQLTGKLGAVTGRLVVQ